MKNYGPKNFSVSKIIFVIIFVFSLINLNVYAKDNISVVFNGRNLTFDVDPFIKDGRTLVPFRGILQEFGATVNWDSENQAVTATKSDMEVKLNIGSNLAIVNGSTKTLDVPAQIINNRTFIPLRFVSENLGMSVEWIDSLHQIKITSSVSTLFTFNELKKYNGQNGNPAYIAVDGIVYDVTNVLSWRNGSHNGQYAGNDMSSVIDQSPHGRSVLDSLPIVGSVK